MTAAVFRKAVRRMGGPVKKKRPFPKKAAAFAAVLVLFTGCVFGGYRWSRTLPEVAFAYWWAVEPEIPEPNGVTLVVDEIKRNRDGSGSIRYTLANETGEGLYWIPTEPMIDYFYEGAYHTVYPSTIRTLVAHYPESLPPGESVSFEEELEPKILALPGDYRLRIDSVGMAEFEVTKKGDIKRAA